MKHGRGFLVIVVQLSLVFAVVPMSLEAADQSTDRTAIVHAPILIDGDSDFTFANGVTGGAGSPEDPYVISGWQIDASSATGIEVRNTDSHLLIESVSISSPVAVWQRGVILHSSSNVTVQNCTVMNTVGIEIYDGVHISVEGCTVQDGWGYIAFILCNDVAIESNVVASYQGSGIHANSSYEFTILDNSISGQKLDGITVSFSSYGTVAGNIVDGCGIGIRLHWLSQEISVYGNDVIDNAIQASDELDAENSWNSAYPAGGNFWSDYAGVDLMSGPGQDVPGSDGIGDTPYLIDAGSQDNYPLMEPVRWEPPLTPREPIFIDSDAEFIPENGVTRGSGIESDPYVIEYWDINASTANGVNIINTLAWFVIKDMNIHSGTYGGMGTYRGVYMENVANGRIEDVTTQGNAYDVELRYCSNCFIVGNEFHNDFSGAISLLFCSSVEVSCNVIFTDYSGLSMLYCQDIVVSANWFSAGGMYLGGGASSDYDSHTITADNSVAGLPILYYKNLASLSLSGVRAAQVFVVSSSNVHLSDLNLSGVQQGLVLAHVNNALVERCVFLSDSYNSVRVHYCNKVVLYRNTVADTIYYALESESSQYVQIIENSVTGCSYGIVVRSSSWASVVSNHASDNFAGVLMYQASHCQLLDNDLSYNAIGLYMYSSSSCEIAGNSLTNNGIAGIQFDGTSASNNIHHNNLVSNSAHVVGFAAAGNTWDSGYPGGGNYWSGHSSMDLFSGPDQDIPGSDGVCDSPYVMDADDTDRYPFVEEVPPMDLINLVGRSGTTVQRGISWIVYAESDGTWVAEIVNCGLVSIVLRMSDASSIDRLSSLRTSLFQLMYFPLLGAYPVGTVLSKTVTMTAGHYYRASVMLMGALGTSAQLIQHFG